MSNARFKGMAWEEGVYIENNDRNGGVLVVLVEGGEIERKEVWSFSLSLVLPVCEFCVLFLFPTKLTNYNT